MSIYLDNAATTPLDPLVLEAMMPYMTEKFGNPSSSHSHGRAAKAGLEMARKTIAGLINASPGEIYFTSGGTEADNTILTNSIRQFGIRNVLTARTEHHAVLHTLEALEERGEIEISYVNTDEKGHVLMDSVSEFLKTYPNSLVSLMQANNEIANVTDIYSLAEMCEEHGAFFHSDTVQAMGHFPHDMQQLKAHGIVCSAHKLHGPKGVGFMYLKKNKRFAPFIKGGPQERNMRGGTENITGIVGMSKALELAYAHMEEHQKHILGLKNRMIRLLSEKISGVEFNGDSESPDSLYTVLNVSLPPSANNEFILFNLDIQGISASGGSACASGANTGSHVLTALGTSPDMGAVRFSFSKFNAIKDIDQAVEALVSIYQ
ncbi:MAG: cysteine desulfurase [Cyclobacteriaceae bacterium]|nr:cysteine desulfurase [Cyclobacteriaceae bacterium]